MRSLLIVVACSLMSCMQVTQEDRVNYRNEHAARLTDIEYYFDESTNLCFAGNGAFYANNATLTNVPCNADVMDRAARFKSHK